MLIAYLAMISYLDEVLDRYQFQVDLLSYLQGSYTVKVINPSRKRDAKTLSWHSVTDTFTSPLQIKEKLIESFSDHVPGISEIGRFIIGFFESQNQRISDGLYHQRT